MHNFTIVKFESAGRLVVADFQWHASRRAVGTHVSYSATTAPKQATATRRGIFRCGGFFLVESSFHSRPLRWLAYIFGHGMYNILRYYRIQAREAVCRRQKHFPRPQCCNAHRLQLHRSIGLRMRNAKNKGPMCVPWTRRLDCIRSWHDATPNMQKTVGGPPVGSGGIGWR